MRKLSEENFDTIRQYNKNLSELYLMVENGCQSDITVVDMTECMECICSLIKIQKQKKEMERFKYEDLYRSM